MKVVANAGPIGRRIVVAVDLELILPVGTRLEQPRNDVGLRVVILAESAVRPRTGDVEVAKPHCSQLASRLHPLQYVLEGKFARPVRVDRRGGRRLDDGYRLRLSVDGRGRREDDRVYVSLSHLLEHRDRSGQIVLEVAPWVRL